VPTLAPSAAPIGPLAPTPAVAPASPPAAPAGPLPAPLYVLDNGQIARIERDGVTRALVTAEKAQIAGFPPIATFVLGPGGDMAYVAADLKLDRLVRAGPRGEAPHTLYGEAGHELSDLAWSPDGAQIYLRLLNNREPPDIPSGLYRIPASGGPPELVRADDPVDNLANPAPTISGYRPFAWSPDGSRLLVEVFSLFYDGCDLAVLPAAGGSPVRLTVPAGTKTFCGEAAWSADGAAVYFLAGAGAGPTIWRGDAASGAVAPQAAPDVLARAPRPLPDGRLRFFLVRPSDPASFEPAELSAPQAAPASLGPPLGDPLAKALWAPDGGGAVTVVQPPTTSVDLRWVPVGGAPISLPNTTLGVAGMAWGAGT
jgi:hypothetical protein